MQGVVLSALHQLVAFELLQSPMISVCFFGFPIPINVIQCTDMSVLGNTDGSYSAIVPGNKSLVNRSETASLHGDHLAVQDVCCKVAPPGSDWPVRQG